MQDQLNRMRVIAGRHANGARCETILPGVALAQFKGYGDNIELQSADKLIIHKADNGHVVVIEYEVHGTIIATGVKYNNRFCSIIKIEGRKIAYWRDYMDSLAARNALTVPSR
jgi:ketosteroid isomerase-like protein